MKWRIAVPVVIIVGVLGYVIYSVAKRPVSADIQRSLPVTMTRFARTLHDERDAAKLLPYCSRIAVQQCRALLAEIARREQQNPAFRFERFRISAQSAPAGTQTTSIHLIDSQRNVFLVLNCKATQLPDGTWKITEVTWNPLVAP